MRLLAFTAVLLASCTLAQGRVVVDTAATVRVWQPGEVPAATVEVVDTPSDTLGIVLVTDDGRQWATSARYAVAPGRHTLPLPQLEPGFYRLTVSDGDSVAMAMNIGYHPEAIVSPYDGKPDFQAFWQKGLEELAGVDPKFRIIRELKDKSTAARRVYLVEMQSVPDEPGGTPAKVRAYWAEPRQPGRYPTIIHYPGTDGGGGEPWCMGGDDIPDMCELIVSVRGQMINNRPPYKKEGERYANDYYTYGFGDLRRHYYYGAYLDVVRAIDFAASRQRCDTANIFATGYSQGGAHTLVAAALGGGRIRAAAPSITGHSDFPDDIRLAQWPENRFAAKRAVTGMTTEEMLDWLSYFDVKNLAPRVTCPVITNLSLQDTTDPPHVGMAAYNLMGTPSPADRPLIINPLLGHRPAPDWSDTFLRFLRSHIRR